MLADMFLFDKALENGPVITIRTQMRRKKRRYADQEEDLTQSTQRFFDKTLSAECTDKKGGTRLSFCRG